MRLMYSGRDFAWIYERQDQVSFLDGHVRAFAHFGGVPARVAYDNLRAAVVRILVGGRARADAAVRGARVALPARAVLLSPRRRPRQGRRRSAREGAPPASAGADSERADAGMRSTPRCSRVSMRGDARRRRSARASSRSSGLARGARTPFVAEATTLRDGQPARAGARWRAREYSVPCRWAGLDLVVRIGPTTVTIVGRDGTRIGHPRKRFGERVDRLPALSARAGAQAAGGASGAPGSAARSRRAVPGGVGAPPRGARPARGGAALGENSRRARDARRGRRRAGARGRAGDRRAADAGADRHRRAVRIDVPAPLRDLDIASGCAADYDRWLTGASA